MNIESDLECGMRNAECGVTSSKILYITENGLKLARQLQELLPHAEILKFFGAGVRQLWQSSDKIVFIMAAGIVVRTIAPLLKNKKSDPAVVVLDEQGKFAISLVSGHLGGANRLAEEIAAHIGGQAVITTASDVNDLPAIDLWARDNDLVIENWEELPHVGTRYVNNGGLRVYSDVPHLFPDQFLRVVDPRFADVIITHRKDVYSGSPRCSIIGEGCATGACRVKHQVYLRPSVLVLGMGCNSGTSAEEIENAVHAALEEHNFVFSSIRSVATIDLKGREPGLLAFAEKHALPLLTFTPEELNRVEGTEKSEAVFAATGAWGVAEPAALLASGTDRLVVSKQKIGNVTLAIAVQAKRSTE